LKKLTSFGDKSYISFFMMCFNLLSCCTRRQDFHNDEAYSSVALSRTSKSTYWFHRSSENHTASLEEIWERREVECLQAIESGLQLFEISDFRIEKQVGGGSNSNVQLLVRASDKKKFAGKMLQHGSCWSLINEATIMSKLSGMCSTIASAEGVIVNPKCLVLKYYKNGDLGTVLMRDNENISNGSATEFPFLRRLKYIRDACKAVSFMNKSSLCHRDLAMRNFLLSDDMEHVLLTDFSLSRYVKGNNPQVTFSSEVPIVAPPETFQRSHSHLLDKDAGGWHYSLKSDTWGLGITMFEIVTKKNFKIMTNHHHLLPTNLPKGSLPPKTIFNKGWDLWYTIRCCWNTELEKRPWSWEVLEKVTAMIANPIGGSTGNIYYNRYSTRLAQTSSSNNEYYCPTLKYTMSEFMTQKTDDMDFSEVTEINQTQRREDTNSVDSGGTMHANPNPNLLSKNFLVGTPNRNSNHVESSTSSISSDITIAWPETKQLRSNLYCQSLDLDPRNSVVTNIAECKNKHFFDDNAIELIKQSEPIPVFGDIGDFRNTEKTDSVSLIHELPSFEIQIVSDTKDSIDSEKIPKLQPNLSMEKGVSIKL